MKKVLRGFERFRKVQKGSKGFRRFQMGFGTDGRGKLQKRERSSFLIFTKSFFPVTSRRMKRLYDDRRIKAGRLP
jgi:hypothetical protein